MNTVPRVLAIGVVMLVSACSDSSSSDSSGPAETPAPTATSDVAPVSESAPAAAPAIDGHELERAINDPLDRARAVEGDLMKAAEDQDEKLQDQGG